MNLKSKFKQIPTASEILFRFVLHFVIQATKKRLNNIHRWFKVRNKIQIWRGYWTWLFQKHYSRKLPGSPVKRQAKHREGKIKKGSDIIHRMEMLVMGGTAFFNIFFVFIKRIIFSWKTAMLFYCCKNTVRVYKEVFGYEVEQRFDLTIHSNNFSSEGKIQKGVGYILKYSNVMNYGFLYQSLFTINERIILAKATIKTKYQIINIIIMF